MSMTHWWNGSDRWKQKYSGQTLCHCHFFHHISYIY